MDITFRQLRNWLNGITDEEHLDRPFFIQHEDNLIYLNECSFAKEDYYKHPHEQYPITQGKIESMGDNVDGLEIVWRKGAPACFSDQILSPLFAVNKMLLSIDEVVNPLPNEDLEKMINRIFDSLIRANLLTFKSEGVHDNTIRVKIDLAVSPKQFQECYTSLHANGDFWDGRQSKKSQ